MVPKYTGGVVPLVRPDYGGGGSGPAATIGPPPWQPGALDTRLGFVYRFYVTMGSGDVILAPGAACQHINSLLLIIRRGVNVL